MYIHSFSPSKLLFITYFPSTTLFCLPTLECKKLENFFVLDPPYPPQYLVVLTPVGTTGCILCEAKFFLNVFKHNRVCLSNGKHTSIVLRYNVERVQCQVEEKAN